MHHEHHAQLDSTNERAVRVWREHSERSGGGQSEAMLITADVQTAGRGRQGRRWQSPAGGLWMTLAWPAPADADRYRGLPLVAGLAVAEGIAEATPLQPTIKWPNDLLIEGKKAAGILCEYHALPCAAVMVGIGVNANLTAADLGEELRHPATTLREQMERPIDIVELREAIVGRVVNRLRQFERDGLGVLLPAVRARLAWLDQPIVCELPGNECRQGRMAGIDEQGRLLVREGAGRPIALDIGEIVHLSPSLAKPYPEPTGHAMELPIR